MNSFEIARELIKNGFRVRYAESDGLGVIGIIPKDDPNIPGYSFRIWFESGYWMLGVPDPWPYETILKDSQQVEEVIRFAIEVYGAPKPQQVDWQTLIRGIIEHFNHPPIEVYRYDEYSIFGYAHDQRYQFAVFREMQTWFAVIIDKNAPTPTRPIGYSPDLMSVVEMVRTAVNKGS